MANEKCNIYAYDFFDTIVHRRCHPKELLYNWAKHCARFFLFKLTAKDIYQIRKEEERKTGEKDELKYDELMRKIYREVQELTGYERRTEEEFVSFSYKVELSEELKNIYIDENRIKEIKEFRRQGKSIIIISDFYMGINFFETVLSNLGIRKIFSALFISSDCGMRKSTGKLYQYVCEKLNCVPGQIMMTGDNRISDVLVPKSMGFHTRFLEYKDNNKLNSLAQLKRIYRHKTHRDPESNPINGYAAELLYFFGKLYKSMVEEGVEEVLFCAREGRYLKQLFDLYQTICFGDLKVHSIYFYVSRKAVFVPSLADIKFESFDILFRQYSVLSVEEFLKNIGFSKSFIYRLCDECNMDITAKITSESNDLVKQKIINSKLFVEEYNRIRLEQRQLFMDYLQEICADMNKIVLVDVGWKGTIQDCIRRILPSDVKVCGYYLGLKTLEYGCENPEDKHGVLFSDYPVKSSDYGILEHESLFYERIFVANHGPVIGYMKENNSKVIPLIENRDEEVKIYQDMEKYQDSFKDTFKNLLYAYRRTIFLPDNLYDVMIENALWRVCVDFPRIWFLKEHAKKLVPENFGNIDIAMQKSSWKEVISHLRKNQFGMTDYIFRVLEKTHLTFLKPLGNIFCKCNYYLRLLQLKNRHKQGNI